VILTAEKVAQEPLPFTGRNGKHTEAEIDHINGTTLVEMPPMAHRCWNRHLARG
jgi:hypothetical protein